MLVCSICQKCIGGEDIPYKLKCGHTIHTACLMERYDKTRTRPDGSITCQKCNCHVDLHRFAYNNFHVCAFFKCADYIMRINCLVESNFVNATELFPNTSCAEQRRACLMYHGLFINRMTLIYNAYHNILGLEEMESTYNKLTATTTEHKMCFNEHR